MNNDIFAIAKASSGLREIDISHLLGNGDYLSMYHNWIEESLSFVYKDGTKAAYIDGAVKTVKMEYPYFKSIRPDRMVEETCGIFRTGDYTLVKGGMEKEPNFREVANIILKVVKMFKK